ncbi:MAG: ATP-binding protein [Pseudomonadales bacterium]|nr:ATP-binding protein [Gemmatimonadales bacterium]MBP9035655.1 ATP-binding protein [Pseudomonadales bacterium]
MNLDPSTDPQTALRQRAAQLNLNGLIAHWDEAVAGHVDLVARFIDWEERERSDRGLKRRLRNARLGAFKPIADFDWQWPRVCDRAAISDLMTLGFVKEATNVVLIGGNGIGKTTIAQNLLHQSLLRGHSALMANASAMLGDLAAQDSERALRRRIDYYARPQVLLIDEVGYLSYANRHADLLFEIVNRRYEAKSTIVTTNRVFTEWNAVFPNATCVVSIIDRLVHHAEVIKIEGDSYRAKEAHEREAARNAARRHKARPAKGDRS